MSLIESIMEEIESNDVSSRTWPDMWYVEYSKIREILEKHLKQSESKSIDDLIEKRKGNIQKAYIPYEKQFPNMVILDWKELLSDLENLKQSDEEEYSLEQSEEDIKKDIWIDDLQYWKQSEKVVDENTSDWYHTFKELYEHRVALYIRLVNDTNFWNPYHWIKSKLHFDGSSYDWWFIVQWYIKGKQISYHLPMDKRDIVNCAEVEKADERDWHTPSDVVKRLLD